MLLAIDIGNTRVKCGVLAQRSLLHTFGMETRRERGSDETTLLLRELAALRGVRASEVRAAIVASVVPALTPVLQSAIASAFGCEALLAGPELDTGIVLSGPSPEQVGADRVVNAAAARALELQESAERAEAPRGSIIVDLGTATKLDCVSPRGEFLGGVIAPGVHTSLEGLIARAARLGSVELRAPEHVLGRTTMQCLQSGIVYGHASLVDGLVARLRAELGFECGVIATGGLAPLIAPHTCSLGRVAPELTLRGLALIYERNAGRGARLDA